MALTAKWYLLPSWNWVKVQAIGRGKAFTSPTYKIQMEYFTKLQGKKFLRLWYSTNIHNIWEVFFTVTFFHRLVLGAAEVSW